MWRLNANFFKMDSLTIEGTNTVPSINFDSKSRKLCISGYSRPENVRDFYDQVLQWICNYKGELVVAQSKGEKDLKTVSSFSMIYFNSASAKFICDIITLFREMTNLGLEVDVNWHYDKDDTEMLEVGEDLAEMADFKFSFIPD